MWLAWLFSWVEMYTSNQLSCVDSQYKQMTSLELSQFFYFVLIFFMFFSIKTVFGHVL